MLSILGFLIVLGPLVIVHEFGHYIFARIFGVKAEVFSIGFGPKLWSKQLGETELRFAAIPLGGFVKLLGEDPEQELKPEEVNRALQRQKPWKRFFIFFGGPLFNFLFAIVIFMAILAIGEPQVANVIGRVVHHSAAEQAGFRSGDRVLKVDGNPVRKFDDMMAVITENPGKQLAFEVAHPGSEKPVAITAKPVGQPGYSLYGENTEVGDIPGLLPAARTTEAGVSNPASAAARAGIKTGDLISALNSATVKSWEELERVYSALQPGTSFSLSVQSGATGPAREIRLTKPQKTEHALGADLGLFSSELFVEKALPNTPAEKAGIQPGDRLVSVGTHEVDSFFDLKDDVQAAGEKEGRVPLKWERSGKTYSASIVPTTTNTRDPALKKTKQFTIGVVPMLSWAEPVMVTDRIWNPFVLVYQGTERMVSFTWRNLVSIQKMITRDVSIGTLGGPILIGKIAGESIARGLIAFLTTMAILSVGLGVLNVLPVPVLDGGHLMLLLLESIRGKPLTIRQMEIVQQVGLSLIVLLMVIVMKNDITRLPFFDR